MKKVIKFYADWCAPCVTYAPTFKQITDQLKGWEVETYNIDTPEGVEYSIAYAVTSIPSTVIMVDGSEPKVIVGALSAEELAKELI